MATNSEALDDGPFEKGAVKVPRANRHYIPGCVWHLTHRCHKKEFLLKFARDRRRWLQWLFEAKKRYGLSVLTNSGNPQQTTRAFWGMKMAV